MFGTFFGKSTVNSISPSQAREQLAANKNILLLDVRSPDEYRQIHIPHSISLPLDQLKAGIEKIAKDKDAPMIVYCLSGMRAAQACRQLSAMGYTNISNMGGIQSWRYETERG